MARKTLVATIIEMMIAAISTKCPNATRSPNTKFTTSRIRNLLKNKIENTDRAPGS